MSEANPLLSESPLPFALPDFAALKPQHYREAIERGLIEHLAELDAIAANPEPATVENTLDAWERAGALLDRAVTAFWAVKACDTNDELDAIEAEFAPKLAQHADAILLNRTYFNRLEALSERYSEIGCTDEQRWVLDDLLADFRSSGVALPVEQQDRLRTLNTRLAELGTQFEQANLAARNAGGFDVTEDELDGLAPDEIVALSQDGHLHIDLVNTSSHPLLEKLSNRDLRRRLFEASIMRGQSGASDTRGIIAEMARIRAERAQLLGFPHHAALVVDRACARTTAAVTDMLGRLAPAALVQAKTDASELARRFSELYPGETFAAWDWAYVAEVVRREQFDLDFDELAPYLDAGVVLKAVYGAAEKLYGITFVRRDDLRGHTAEAEVYEVHNDDGSVAGLFIMDFWARPTKQGGAWMSNIVEGSGLTGALPVVTNNCNYAKGTKTISWDDVITMFHEFGHALHGLFADSRYPSHAGANTPRDFVEFPSQVNEHWAWEPGCVLPPEWVEKLIVAERFNQGFHNFETWAAMVLDQAWHTTPLDELPANGDDVEAFEAAALERAGLPYELIPPRYRSQYFQHIWGHGYAAAYYSYVWAEVMDADAVAWFEENGGATRENGELFRRNVLARGGSVNVMDTWRSFRGRDPELAPLLKRKGIA